VVNLSPEEQENVQRRLATLIALRRHTTPLSEKEISKHLGYDSPEKLYGYLIDRGVPAWLVYPPDYPRGHSSAPTTKKPPQQAERKPRATGAAAKQLPSPSEAEDLFGAMVTYIKQRIRQALRYEITLKGKRFETWTKPYPPFDDETAALEASAHPPDPLWRLIAIYALCDESKMFRSSEVRPKAVDPMERLTQALHHEPEKAEREKLRRYVKGDNTEGINFVGLESRAKQVATLVLGGTVEKRGGRPPAEHPTTDMAAAEIVAKMRHAGVPHEQIRRELNEQNATNYSLEDIKRLGDLGQGPQNE
jgi:hypothetical protein